MEARPEPRKAGGGRRSERGGQGGTGEREGRQEGCRGPFGLAAPGSGRVLPSELAKPQKKWRPNAVEPFQ